MRRPCIAWMFFCIVSVLLAGSAYAASTTDSALQTDNDAQLDMGAAVIDELSATGDGGAAILQTIQAMFNVTASQIKALRAENLGYGEIIILLSIAQSMPGGISDATIASVLALRQGAPVMGWGAIASSMGVKLGTLVSAVEKAGHDANKVTTRGQSGAHRDGGAVAGTTNGGAAAVSLGGGTTGVARGGHNSGPAALSTDGTVFAAPPNSVRPR